MSMALMILMSNGITQIHMDDHKSSYIPSLAQTIHFLTTPDPEQRESFLAAERPPRWYWGLIQVCSCLILNFLPSLFMFPGLFGKSGIENFAQLLFQMIHSA